MKTLAAITIAAILASLSLPASAVGNIRKPDCTALHAYNCD